MTAWSGFDGRAVAVTGGGSGIGRAVALQAANAGADVAVIDWSADGAERVAAEVAGLGRAASAHVADVADPGAAARAIGHAVELHGRLDVLVNNAAVAEADDILEMSVEDWNTEVGIILGGAFHCTRAALPGMRERGSGVIVNVTSVNGLVGFGQEAYSAAKAGLVSFTQNLAIRYGPDGIRANAVAPGTVRTAIWQSRLERDPEVLDRLARWYPLRRVGEPDDVASAVMFLASDEAAWISGVVLRVDGGLLAGSAAVVSDVSGDA